MNQRFSNLREFRESARRDKESLVRHEMCITTRDGCDVRVTKIGDGPPVFFVPMLEELNFLYLPAMERLSSDFSTYIYAPKLNPSGFTTPEERGNELAEIINAVVGTQPVHLVAWSDSAAGLCRLLEHRPEFARSASFIAVPDRFRFPFPINLGLFLLYYLPIERLPIRPLLLHGLGKLMGGSAVSPAWVEDQASGIRQVERIFKYACLPSIKEHSPLKGKIPCRVLVIGGDTDKVSSPAQSERFASAMGARIVILQGGDHFPTYTIPEKVSIELRNFFIKHEP